MWTPHFDYHQAYVTKKKNSNRCFSFCHVVKKNMDTWKNGKCHTHCLFWPWLPSGQIKKKTKMSRTPSGLAIYAVGPKKRKNKKFHACRLVWPWPSLAKKRKNKKCHARSLAWLWLPSGQNKRKNKKNHTHCLVWPWPSLAKNKGNTKNVMQTIWSGCGCHRAKQNRKTKYVTYTVWLIPIRYNESSHHNVNREVNITAICGLAWYYQSSNNPMSFS